VGAAHSKMKAGQSNWAYLAQEAFLLLMFAYVFLLGGGFSALVDFKLQAFSTALAIIVLGGWLFLRIFGKQGLPASAIDWALVLFLLSQVIATAFSEDPRRSLDHLALWLAYVFGFYFVLDLLGRGWRQNLFVKSILIMGAVVLVFAAVDLRQLYLEWRRLITGLEFYPGFQQRLSTILGDPNLLAALVNLLIPLALASFFVLKSKVAKGSLAVYLGLSLVILVFTDSRGGLLGLGTSLLVFSVLWILLVSESAKETARSLARWLWGRKFLLLGVIAALITAITFVAWLFLSFEGSTTHAPVAEARDIFWDAAIDAVKADPLTGAGPGMYPIYLMKIWSIPPARPFLHAHSFPFQVAAESGLVGVVALAVLIFIVVRRARNAWRGLDSEKRAWWVAATAALAGLGAHSIVDDFFPFPAIGLTAFVYLAFVMSPESGEGKSRNLSPWLIVSPGLAAAVFGIYSLNAYSHADRAVSLGSQGDWQAAASEMRAAANADPRMAFYWLQAGYAYGRAALDNPDTYDEAIAIYERGASLEPHYSLNQANLSALLWIVQQKEQALQHVRIATSAAPDSWLIWLNQGLMEEELGLQQRAVTSLQRSILRNPEIQGSNLWSTTPIRQAASQDLDLVRPSEESRQSTVALVREAREAIAAKNFGEARSLLGQAYSVNDQDGKVYVGFGELALLQGDLERAENYAEIALWIQATNNQSKVEAILLSAEISMAKGESDQAFQRYKAAYDAILAATSYGWGSYGWSPYAWFVFQRKAFPEDVLPQLVRADITLEIAQRLMPLADLYESAGELDKAQEIRDSLQVYMRLPSP